LEKTSVAIIGGTGLEDLFQGTPQTRLKTPYGMVSSIVTGTVENRKVILLHRHGINHVLPPHRVNYRANVYALHRMGVNRILATNAVGAINQSMKPGDIVIPSDFIDFTKTRPSTFYDKAPVTHVDVSDAYCPIMRRVLIESARKCSVVRVWRKGVLVCTEGPRFETPAEIDLFRRLGCDVVGMTGFPEVVLARELQMCYASICYVSNMAAGMQRRLKASEVGKMSKQTIPKVKEVLFDSVRSLSDERGATCPCVQGLRDARFT
jgi:5'-methylthioadenosine phosphorylase